VAALTGEAPPPAGGRPKSGIRALAGNSIKRQTKKYRLGIRGATALDPELFMFGAHGQFGPFFSDNIYARPNLEFGFGELTTLIASNFEAIYRLPIVQRTSQWNMYVAAGRAQLFPSVASRKKAQRTAIHRFQRSQSRCRIQLPAWAAVQRRVISSR
jgi:hypothetical protein